MENNRKKPVKTYKKPTPKKPVAPVKKSDIASVLKYVFLGFLLISVFVFLNNFFNISELTNNYIKTAASWISGVQVFLYAMIFAAFGFAGYLIISGKSQNKYATYAGLIALIVIIGVHYLAFNKAFEDVDDNASYMIAAKSLVDKGAPYFLYMPEVKPDTEGAIGLPLLLIPLYKIWGMNYQPMEAFIFLLTIGSIVFCYLFFRKTEGKLLAFILTVLFATHPYITSFSSIIMTEIPFIFWSLLAMFLILKFEEKDKINWFLLLVAAAAVFMTYLTRAIGAGFIVAVIVYFLIKTEFWKNIKDVVRKTAFWKFISISALLIIFLVGYQLWLRSLGGTSQADSLAKMSLMDQFLRNLSLVWEVLSQNIFSGKLARYEVNPKYLEPVNFIWIVVFLLTLTGLIQNIIKKQIAGLYFLFVLLVLLIGNVDSRAIVVSRYLIVFTPFLIYFFLSGIRVIAGFFDKKKMIATTLMLIVAGFLLGNSFLGTAFNIQRSAKASLYEPPYQAFLDCAVWAKDNFDKEAVVASRKERIFYIFSDGLRGYKHFALSDSRQLEKKISMEEYEKGKLEQFAKNNTSYIIIDTFSSSSVNIIYPIIQKYPDKFKLLKIIGDEKKGACYVYQVIKWWS